MIVASSNNRFFQIDESDAHILQYASWEVSDLGYVRASIPINGERFLHRILLLPQGKEEVDHKNNDASDNRQDNLRIATRQQNAASRPFPRGPSGYRGVVWHVDKWQARIRVDGQLLSLGRFHNPVEAARAYDRAATKYFGEFASLNGV